STPRALVLTDARVACCSSASAHPEMEQEAYHCARPGHEVGRSTSKQPAAPSLPGSASRKALPPPCRPLSSMPFSASCPRTGSDLMPHTDRMAAAISGDVRSAYLAAEEYETPLAEELARRGVVVSQWHGRLALSPDPPVSSTWALDVWTEPREIEIPSV